VQSVSPAVQGATGPSHGTPLQHCDAVVHAWPYRKHMPVPVDVVADVVVVVVVAPVPVELVALVVLEVVVGLHGPHWPAVDPIGVMHVRPLQQSALVVQTPHALLHVVVPQT
jgi:hypothetical protein